MQLAVGETLSRPIRATPEETTGPSRGPNIPLRDEAPIAKRWRGCSREPTDDERRRGMSRRVSSSSDAMPLLTNWRSMA
eukprot:scaffold875_cov120-Isochrysis_galbana.AAC.5